MTEKNEAKSGFSRAEITLLALIVGLSITAVLNGFVLDERYFSWLSGHPQKWFAGNLGYAFRLLGKTLAPMWLLFFWALVSRHFKPALTALLALLMVLPVVSPLKAITQRKRPRAEIKTALLKSQNQPVESKRGSYESFPSGDTATAFAVSAALTTFVALPWTVLFFGISVGVGLLRLVDGAHYPSDVFAGAAIGVICGLIALQISRRWLSSVSPRPRFDAVVCLLCLIIIPILQGLLHGLNTALIFIETYAPIAVAVFIIASVVRRVMQPASKKSCEH